MRKDVVIQVNETSVKDIFEIDETSVKDILQVNETSMNESFEPINSVFEGFREFSSDLLFQVSDWIVLTAQSLLE